MKGPNNTVKFFKVEIKKNDQIIWWTILWIC